MDEFIKAETKGYRDIRSQIQSGDILLCSGNSLFANVIQQATKSPWSHVGFILRLEVIDRVMVLESVESIGVRTVPLSSYVGNYNASGKGYPGKILIARHKDLNPKNISNLSKQAVDLLGYPYDYEEIARIAARIGLGKLGVHHEKSMPGKELICSEYAYVCFQSVGVNIDYNAHGFISPADFARCPKVEAVGFVETHGASVNSKAGISFA